MAKCVSRGGSGRGKQSAKKGFGMGFLLLLLVGVLVCEGGGGGHACTLIRRRWASLHACAYACVPTYFDS